jgi:hypothetical protein
MAKKECIDHRLWVNNLSFAQWVLMGACLYYTIFTDSAYSMIALLAASWTIWAIRRTSERKHYEWHLGQEREDDDM